MSVGSFRRALTPGPDSRKPKLLLLVMGDVLPKAARPRRSPPAAARSASSGNQCRLLQAHRVPAARRGPLQTRSRRPIGLVLGRWLWTLFAEELYAVPLASVPTSLVAVGVGALVVAYVVALLPARHVARFPTALVLGAE